MRWFQGLSLGKKRQPGAALVVGPTAAIATAATPAARTASAKMKGLFQLTLLQRC
jgi:hypothetical protein